MGFRLGVTLLLLSMGLALPAHAADAPPAARPLLRPVPAPAVAPNADNPVAADVNNDGRDDLVVPAGRRLTTLLSNGDGTFAATAAAPLALPMPVSEAVAADFDGDGNVDLALADHDSYDVLVLLGDGRGAFAPAPGSPFASRTNPKKPHTHGLAVGDFNRDGRPDLVLANQDDGDLSLLLGDGAGRFAVAPRSPFACGRSPYPIAVADFDADDNDDVLVPNSAPSLRTVTLMAGNGRGELAPAPGSPIGIAGQAFFAATGDLDGDGRTDAVVTHAGDEHATILLNDGRGGLAPAPAASPLRIGHSAWGVVIHDMDRDGRADLCFAADDAVRVFLGARGGEGGGERFVPAPGSPFATPKGAWRLCVADFDADGRADVVARYVDAKELVLLMGQ